MCYQLDKCRVDRDRIKGFGQHCSEQVGQAFLLAARICQGQGLIGIS